MTIQCQRPPLTIQSQFNKSQPLECNPLPVQPLPPLTQPTPSPSQNRLTQSPRGRTRLTKVRAPRGRTPLKKEGCGGRGRCNKMGAAKHIVALRIRECPLMHSWPMRSWECASRGRVVAHCMSHEGMSGHSLALHGRVQVVGEWSLMHSRRLWPCTLAAYGHALSHHHVVMHSPQPR